MPIRNIYVINNSLLSDQEIIEIAKLSEYPSSVINRCSVIENRLKKNDFIYDVNVSKRWLYEVHIDVVENRPLFYYEEQTFLKDGSSVNDDFKSPLLINFVPENIFLIFKEKMALVEPSVLNRVSEIQYNPNEVDDSRFLLSMKDGNYVYLTLSKFDMINEYISIIKTLENERGILYLDSGAHFEVLEN